MGKEGGYQLLVWGRWEHAHARLTCCVLQLLGHREGAYSPCPKWARTHMLLAAVAVKGSTPLNQHRRHFGARVGHLASATLSHTSPHFPPVAQAA